ncbi:lipoyl(octanoyl) transferase LipB [Armatimonas rosea]|uniref:Octanoyltransferase n=1 Tax=Armatimonas rosea TaxID=685828 RepID=A0A7W9SNZ1_ARMRO|nr:lipoyl(octanoyl) transferase LipB [Armatimonas rosea]MBB6049629.1 lipoyl(octanoyl) transferase [Armatimonas rosea]
MEIINLLSEGLIGYHEGWERQRARVAMRIADEVPDGLLLVEHASVVTYGKTAKPEFRLLSEAEYAARGIELVATDRGGDVTYHGPGQLTGYPIVHLGEGRRDLHKYVWTLEEAIIRAAADFGVAVGRVDFHAGVWTEDGTGYLAAIGVRVQRWVTHHGFGLNVDSRVQAGFETIVPCGQAGKRVVSLSELAGTELSLEEVGEAVSRYLCQYLKFV